MSWTARLAKLLPLFPPREDPNAALREVAETLLGYVATLSTPPKWSVRKARVVAFREAEKNLSGVAPDLRAILQAGLPKPRRKAARKARK